MAAAGDVKNRGGYIVFRGLGNPLRSLHCSALKHYRVSKGSTTAKIDAATYAMWTRLHIKAVLFDFNVGHDLQLTVDSTRLDSSCTTINEPQEGLSKIALAALREVFDKDAPCLVPSCRGQKLFAIALIEVNKLTEKLLHNALAAESHNRPEKARTKLWLRHFQTYTRAVFHPSAFRIPF